MDAEGGMVDCGVGTIVWVRRRNGSWWPGKILGPDELSASHLMSPRSGTPVKLLGREDASVDWYNLEKSKRVKPFRCGEFDDCIERAEASQGMPPKKREKYARREDAILHALDLEKQLLQKKSSSSSFLNGKMDLSFSPPPDQLHIIPAPPSAPVDVEQQHEEEEEAFAPFNSSLPATTPQTLLDKRKRSQQQQGNTNIIIEETLNKRRDRRRPLVQLLKTSVKLPPHIHTLHHLHPASASLHTSQEQRDYATMVGNDPVAMTVKSSADTFEYTQTVPDQLFEKSPLGLSEENNNTGSNEDTETDSSGTESLMSDTYDASTALSDEGEEDIEFIPKSFGRSEGAVEQESMSDDDSGLPEDSGDSVPLQTTVSKWQLKGKRNNRRYTERKAGMLSSSAWMKEETDGIINWEEGEPELEPCLKGGYWEEQYHDPTVYVSSSSPHQVQFGGGGGTGRIKSMLIDVDVGVQSGYQREHVPMISLMSKLNDKAIVGHPIPIETLEDTSSDFLLLSADDESLGGGGGGGGHDSTLQPWRTARRTAKCRVPRPPTLEEDQYEYLVDEDGKGNRKSRKLLKKAQHRKTGTSSCNQKIRTLSSIGGTQQQQQITDDLECYEDEGVMKPESLPTAVACIPVKLVFSRLHEELVARHQ
ncbi:hypothetical protein QVD17_35598 [Tagetes erecta]|uniref:PWWP domain-containing protein n=1 Tax=Tagetes erecta TaxID=13708 RepID=A0AAD8JQV0_TARER|nr:hypothetical protein QVD17_35598 [Tagetes erecta]